MRPSGATDRIPQFPVSHASDPVLAHDPTVLVPSGGSVLILSRQISLAARGPVAWLRDVVGRQQNIKCGVPVARVGLTVTLIYGLFLKVFSRSRSNWLII